MAHEATKKIEIRAFYESHDLSYTKVAEHFCSTGYDISHKSIERWGSKEKWLKGRYSSLSVALENLIDNKIIELIPISAKNIVRDKIMQEMGETITVDTIEKMSETITQELTYLTLNNRYLTKELALNLLNSKTFASKSGSIQTNAIYHRMLLETFQALNGKDEVMPLINPDADTGLSKPINEYTWEELEALRREYE